MVRGFRSKGRDLEEEIRTTLLDLTGVNTLVKSLRHIAGRVLIKLGSWGTKSRLLTNKPRLGGTKSLSTMR